MYIPAPSKASQIITLRDGILNDTLFKRNLFLGTLLECRVGITYIIVFSLVKINFDFFWELPHLCEFMFFSNYRKSCENKPRNIFLRTAQGAASLSLLCLRFCLGIDLGRVAPMIQVAKSLENYLSCPVGCVLVDLKICWTSLQQRWKDWSWTNFLHGSWLCAARINFSPMFLNVVYGVQRLRQHPRAWDM